LAFHNALLYSWQMLGVSVSVNRDAPAAVCAMVANNLLARANVNKENFLIISKSILVREALTLTTSSDYQQLAASVARETHASVTKLPVLKGISDSTKPSSAMVRVTADKHDSDNILVKLSSAPESMRMSTKHCETVDKLAKSARPNKLFISMAAALHKGDEDSLKEVAQTMQDKHADLPPSLRATLVHFLKESTASHYDELDVVRGFLRARMLMVKNLLYRKGIECTDLLLLEFSCFRYGRAPLYTLFDRERAAALHVSSDAELGLRSVLVAIKEHQKINRAMGNNIWQNDDHYNDLVSEIENFVDFAKIAHKNYKIPISTVLNTVKTLLLKLWNKEWPELLEEFQQTGIFLDRSFPSLYIASNTSGTTLGSRFRNDFNHAAHPLEGEFYRRVKKHTVPVFDDIGTLTDKGN